MARGDDELPQAAERIEVLGFLDELGALGDHDAHGRESLRELAVSWR
jgi:hypothetical protein